MTKNDQMRTRLTPKTFIVLLILILTGLFVVVGCLYISEEKSIYNARCEYLRNTIEATTEQMESSREEIANVLDSYSKKTQSELIFGTYQEFYNAELKVLNEGNRILPRQFYLVDTEGYYLDSKGERLNNLYEDNIASQIIEEDSKDNKYSCLSNDDYLMIYTFEVPISAKVSKVSGEFVTLKHFVAKIDLLGYFKLALASTKSAMRIEILDKDNTIIYSNNYDEDKKKDTVGQSYETFINDSLILHFKKPSEILNSIASGETVSFEYMYKQYPICVAIAKFMDHRLALSINSSLCPSAARPIGADVVIFLILIGVLLLLGTGLTVLFMADSKNTRLMLDKEKEVSVALKEASDAKTNFLSRMSHDIRTPINAIIGYTEISLKDETLSKETRENLTNVQTSSKGLLDLVTNVLSVTKIEEGTTILAHEPFDIRDAIDENLEFTKTLIGNKKIILQQDFSEFKNPYIFGDKEKLVRSINNILSNAVKFTSDGGRISYSVRELFTEARKSTLKFIIRDTGCGMDSKFVDHIFEAFTQEAEDNVRTTISGSGLGLHVTKNTIDLMGGRIDVETQKGKGTVFTIVITFDIYNGRLKKENIAPVNDLTGCKILLVEDNEMNVEIAKDLLEMKGATVDVARDGLEAISAFEKSKPEEYDVILMDIMMPNMDGIEATKTIRKLPRMDSITVPIVALTASSIQEELDRIHNAGMDDHLAKPIDIDAVITTITKLRKG